MLRVQESLVLRDLSAVLSLIRQHIVARRGSGRNGVWRVIKRRITSLKSCSAAARRGDNRRFETSA